MDAKMRALALYTDTRYDTIRYDTNRIVSYYVRVSSPVPRPTSVSNGVLIHPAVWPQNGPKSGGAVPLSVGEQLSWVSI